MCIRACVQIFISSHLSDALCLCARKIKMVKAASLKHRSLGVSINSSVPGFAGQPASL